MSIEADLRDRIEYALFELNDNGELRRPGQFEGVVKSFLWDNRMLLDVQYIEDHRAIDATICVLSLYYGFDHFGQYMDSAAFRDWCETLMRSS